jgi:hypothetical protein
LPANGRSANASTTKIGWDMPESVRARAAIRQTSPNRPAGAAE